LVLRLCYLRTIFAFGAVFSFLLAALFFTKASFTPGREKAVGNLPAVERNAKSVPAKDAIDFAKGRLHPGVVVVIRNCAAIPRFLVDEMRRIGEY
jgi:hypothetical protein